MAFETTKDVLDHAREFHGRVSDFYGRLSKKVHKERVKMLLEYLTRHEKHLEESLAQYEEGVSQKILNTWFLYPPPKQILDTCQTVALEEKEDLVVDDVIKIALELDECLVQLYKIMVEHSEFEEVREVFANLLALEKRRELDFVRDALYLKEI